LASLSSESASTQLAAQPSALVKINAHAGLLSATSAPLNGELHFTERL
jgi:hypothetical protein